MRTEIKAEKIQVGDRIAAVIDLPTLTITREGIVNRILPHGNGYGLNELTFVGEGLVEIASTDGDWKLYLVERPAPTVLGTVVEADEPYWEEGNPGRATYVYVGYGNWCHIESGYNFSWGDLINLNGTVVTEPREA